MPCFADHTPTLLDRYLRFVGVTCRASLEDIRRDRNGWENLVWRVDFRAPGGRRLRQTFKTGVGWMGATVTPGDVVSNVATEYGIVHPEHGSGWADATGDDEADSEKIERQIERQIERWKRFLGPDVFENCYIASEIRGEGR